MKTPVLEFQKKNNLEKEKLSRALLECLGDVSRFESNFLEKTLQKENK